MIVVSNTSPVCYLVLIGCEQILPSLFGEIYVPASVVAELRHPDAPPELGEWLRQPPVWLRVLPDPIVTRADGNLHPGEQAAIDLATGLQASLVLIDDRDARDIATQGGLRVIGVLGVLELAHERGLIELGAALGRLLKTSFFVSPALVRRLAAKHGVKLE